MESSTPTPTPVDEKQLKREKRLQYYRDYYHRNVVREVENERKKLYYEQNK